MRGCICISITHPHNSIMDVQVRVWYRVRFVLIYVEYMYSSTKLRVDYKSNTLLKINTRTTFVRNSFKKNLQFDKICNLLLINLITIPNIHYTFIIFEKKLVYFYWIKSVVLLVVAYLIFERVFRGKPSYSQVSNLKFINCSIKS